MTPFAFTVCVGLALTSLPGRGLSTNDLDEYARQAASSRKNCGPIAVWFCLRQVGVETDPTALCRDADLGPSGASLGKLLDLCRDHGVDASAVAVPSKDLESLPVPSILVVDRSHAVVFQGFQPGTGEVQFFEPTTGRMMTAPRDRMVQKWSGEAIVFAPQRLSPAAFGLLTAVAATAVILPALVAARFPHTWNRRTCDPVSLARQ